MVHEKAFQMLVRLQMAGDSLRRFFQGNYSLSGIGGVPMDEAGVL